MIFDKINGHNAMVFILNFAGRKETALILLAVILISLLDLVGIAIVFPYIKVLEDPYLLINNSRGYFDWMIPLENNQKIIAISLALIFLYLCKGYAQGLLIRYQHRRLSTFTARLTNDTVSKILNTRYGLFQEIPGSELASVTYANTVHATIAFRSMIQIGNETCFLVLMGLIFFALSPLLTSIALAILAILAVILFLFVIHPSTQLGEQQSGIENARYRLLFSIVTAIRDIKVMGLASLYNEKNKEISFRYAEVAWKYSFNSALTLLLIEIIVLVILVSSVLAVLSSGIALDVLLPVIGMVAIASLRTVPAFAKLMMSINAYRFSRSFVEKLITIREKLADLKHERMDAEINFEQSIELKDVCFEYGEKPILKKINLMLMRGQSTGIVGISGSGKTTLLDLITGLQPASSGSFFCDGKAFDPFTCSSMEKIVGYVPQALTLLDESIAYNISFQHDVDTQRLQHVIKVANLETLISELPDGVDTRVGENGMNLSGGQRQRIGIARALYIKPELLIFDESTSALDAQTEQKVSSEIAKLKGDVTTLIVSHRLPAVMECDCIYVVSQGMISDKGTHQELLEQNELYRDLHTLQTTFS